MNDQPLGGEPAAPTHGDTVFGNPNGHRPSPAVETILTLDDIMNSARLVERTARICLRGDLVAELNEHLEALARLVDADGNVLAEGDEALAAGNEAAEHVAAIGRIRGEMESAMRSVRFRGMPDDEWRVFEKAHRDGDGQIKDPVDYHNKLIARCAIAPTLTEDDVKAMRSRLGQVQMVTLSNEAYFACTTGGVDVPKSPSFSRGPKQPRSGRN